MSLEKVLRGIGGDDASKLADAAHDFEREQQKRFDGLSVEVAKAINRSTASVMLASLTLAALLAGSLHVGMELGGLKQSVVGLQDTVKRLEERIARGEETLKGIDERTRAILERQQAVLDPGRLPLPANIETSLAPVTLDFTPELVSIFKDNGGQPGELDKRIPAQALSGKEARILGRDDSREMP